MPVGSGSLLKHSVYKFELDGALPKILLLNMCNGRNQGI